MANILFNNKYSEITKYIWATLVTTVIQNWLALIFFFTLDILAVLLAFSWFTVFIMFKTHHVKKNKWNIHLLDISEYDIFHAQLDQNLLLVRTYKSMQDSHFCHSWDMAIF